VPKLPVTGTQVRRLGLDGDGHTEPEPTHGGELQAVSLYCVEALARVAGGRPPGVRGRIRRKLTLEGIDWSTSLRATASRSVVAGSSSSSRSTPRRARPSPTGSSTADRADQPEDPFGGRALVRPGDRRGTRRDRRCGRRGRRRRLTTGLDSPIGFEARPASARHSRANRTPRGRRAGVPLPSEDPTRASGSDSDPCPDAARIRRPTWLRPGPPDRDDTSRIEWSPTSTPAPGPAPGAGRNRTRSSARTRKRLRRAIDGQSSRRSAPDHRTVMNAARARRASSLHSGRRARARSGKAAGPCPAAARRHVPSDRCAIRTDRSPARHRRSESQPSAEKRPHDARRPSRCPVTRPGVRRRARERRCADRFAAGGRVPHAISST